MGREKNTDSGLRAMDIKVMVDALRDAAESLQDCGDQAGAQKAVDAASLYAADANASDEYVRQLDSLKRGIRKMNPGSQAPSLKSKLLR